MTRVRARVEIEREVDVTAVLDGWTLQEVREFAADQDSEGRMILANEGTVDSEDRRIELRSSAVSAYLTEREAREAAALARPSTDAPNTRDAESVADQTKETT